jgi:pantoate--beta-alanine ligase
MGALHSGHIALIERARASTDVVVVSIFVNPKQFDRDDDYSRYPRPLDADIDTCTSLGVEAVYAPSPSEMYPSGFQTTVSVGALAGLMEGSSRPGHFAGVTTVVTKLLHAVVPDVAVFGEKDFQQLAIVRRMVLDLDIGTVIIGHPIVREPDGLAMSSRNARLDPDQRIRAAVIPRALDAAVETVRNGGSLELALARFHEVIAEEPSATLDYVTVFDSDDLSPIDHLSQVRAGSSSPRIACAVELGGIRLIDNRALFES